MKKSLIKPTHILFVVFGIAFVILVPMLIPNQYMMTIMDNALIYFIAILGLTVMLGMGGQVTFSLAGTMGIGAFTVAIATVRAHIHPLIAIVLAVVVASVFSYLIGIALFRLKGTYFAFASIALVQILYSLMLNWKQVTGGADGIAGVPPLDVGFFVCENKVHYFYVFCVFALICGLIVHRIRSSSLGRSLASIRDNEIAARCLGVNVYQTKIISFVLAGAFSGLAGALLAFLNTNITSELFTFEQSSIFLVMAMLGGIGSTMGAFVGTVLLTLLPELMRFMASYYKFVYGVGVILLMIFMPMGLAGVVKSIFKKKKKQKQTRISEVE
ncbi:MAG: branched-chain amino acid ABC transporter permease [Ruminococcaceae bacterium]|nr:branched-chain amino acid ABC transporter permease [Oscillospiraceae bacterium]